MTTTDPVAAMSEADRTFFDSFGFIHLPGLFAPEADRISRGFDEAFDRGEVIKLDPSNDLHHARRPEYDEDLRDMVYGFIDLSPDLAWMSTDPRLTGCIEAILGPEFAYVESDGNRFNCDVWFHADMYGATKEKRHLKVYVYPDALDVDTGCLRVIPGTHRYEDDYARQMAGSVFRPAKAVERFGVDHIDLPSWPIPTQPGDVIIGDFRTLHGTFGGAPGRRLFTLNYRES